MIYYSPFVQHDTYIYLYRWYTRLPRFNQAMAHNISPVKNVQQQNVKIILFNNIIQ